MDIGYRIKELRERKNITRKAVAFELGMSEEGYAKIERNEVSPNIEKLLKISQIIDVPLEEFFKPECTVINNHDLKDNSHGGNGIVINQLPEKYIETLQDLTKSQNREIERQNKEIENLKSEIANLKSNL